MTLNENDKCFNALDYINALGPGVYCSDFYSIVYEHMLRIMFMIIFFVK